MRVFHNVFWGIEKLYEKLWNKVFFALGIIYVDLVMDGINHVSKISKFSIMYYLTWLTLFMPMSYFYRPWKPPKVFWRFHEV